MTEASGSIFLKKIQSQIFSLFFGFVSIMLTIASTIHFLETFFGFIILNKMSRVRGSIITSKPSSVPNAKNFASYDIFIPKI